MVDASQRGSVLVVDDEPTIAEVVARYLQRAGYHARIAGDGPTAVQLARTLRPDLVVLDLMLPGMDGLEVMRRIRDHDRVAVILLTAKGEATDRVIGLRPGASRCAARRCSSPSGSTTSCSTSCAIPGRSSRATSSWTPCGSTRSTRT